jgi:hypothetical protein
MQRPHIGMCGCRRSSKAQVDETTPPRPPQWHHGPSKTTQMPAQASERRGTMSCRVGLIHRHDPVTATGQTPAGPALTRYVTSTNKVQHLRGTEPPKRP